MTSPTPRRRCTSCGNRLATDNTSPRCGACTRTQDWSTPPTLPAAFWASEPMTDALASRHMGRIIHAYRHHPHHPRPLPQELVAGWLGLTQNKLSRLETGRAPEHLSDLTHYATVLAIPPHHLWFHPTGQPWSGGTGTAVPRVSAPVIDASAEGAEKQQDGDDALARLRRATAGVVSSIPAAGVRNLVSEEQERLSFARARPESVDLVTVAGVRQRVEDLDARYESTSSTVLLPEASQLFALATFLGAHAPTLRLRRELLLAEAEAALLVGQLVWDASLRRDHHQARAYLDRAAAAARELGNAVLEGRALLRSTIIALYGERNAETALDLAGRCLTVAETSSKVLAGLAALHAAEAHAMRREAADCDQLLGHAETILAASHDTDEASYLFSPSQIPRLAGSCALLLGKPRHAEQLLTRAVTTPSGAVKADAIALGNLALAHIRQRRPDEASHAFDQTLDVITSTWGGGGIALAFTISREFQPWRHVPAVQDGCDRLLDVMMTATPSGSS